MCEPCLAVVHCGHDKGKHGANLRNHTTQIVSPACKLVPLPKKQPSEKPKRISPNSRATLKATRVPSPTSRTGPWNCGFSFGSHRRAFLYYFVAVQHPQRMLQRLPHFVISSPENLTKKTRKALHPCVQPGESRRESQQCPERRVVFVVLGWGCGGHDYTVFFALFAMLLCHVAHKGMHMILV